jgi:hypothetical protein
MGFESLGWRMKAPASNFHLDERKKMEEEKRVWDFNCCNESNFVHKMFPNVHLFLA